MNPGFGLRSSYGPLWTSERSAFPAGSTGLISSNGAEDRLRMIRRLPRDSRDLYSSVTGEERDAIKTIDSWRRLAENGLYYSLT
jgi:hypothetical protein